MHLTNLIVARKMQSFDDTGMFPAAFYLGRQTFFTYGSNINFTPWPCPHKLCTRTLLQNAIEKIEKCTQETWFGNFWEEDFGLVLHMITCIQALLFSVILQTTNSNRKSARSCYFSGDDGNCLSRYPWRSLCWRSQRGGKWNIVVRINCSYCCVD